MVNLLLPVLVSTAFAAGVAEKPSRHPLPSKKQLIHEATEIPKEVAGIIDEYAVDRDPVEVMVEYAQVRVPRELQKLYSWVQKEMPTHEQLLKDVKEGAQYQRLTDLIKKCEAAFADLAINVESFQADIRSFSERYADRHKKMIDLWLSMGQLLTFLHTVVVMSSYGFWAQCVTEASVIEHFKNKTIKAPYTVPFNSIAIIMFSPLQVIETEQGLSNKAKIRGRLEGDYGATESLAVYKREYERNRKRE